MHIRTINLDPCLTLSTKKKSIWIQDLNVKSETILLKYWKRQFMAYWWRQLSYTPNLQCRMAKARLAEHGVLKEPPCQAQGLLGQVTSKLSSEGQLEISQKNGWWQGCSRQREEPVQRQGGERVHWRRWKRIRIVWLWRRDVVSSEWQLCFLGAGAQRYTWESTLSSCGWTGISVWGPKSPVPLRWLQSWSAHWHRLRQVHRTLAWLTHERASRFQDGILHQTHIRKHCPFSSDVLWESFLVSHSHDPSMAEKRDPTQGQKTGNKAGLLFIFQSRVKWRLWGLYFIVCDSGNLFPYTKSNAYIAISIMDCFSQ